jgi:hypothetical protein
VSFFTTFIRGVVEKRVLVIFASIVLLGLGMFSLSKLPIQPYPGVAPLTIQAISQWPGRSTTEVEQQVTIPVENALAGIPGLQAFRSVSLFGLSVVTLKPLLPICRMSAFHPALLLASVQIQMRLVRSCATKCVLTTHLQSN